MENLFGQKIDQIKPTCILTPILPKGVLEKAGIPFLKKGKPFSSGNTENFTLIHTTIGASFVGDAVLYLKESPCKNLILFGSCGLVQKTDMLDIGSLVCPIQSASYESFSSLLNKHSTDPIIGQANRSFLEIFQITKNGLKLPSVNCASFGSVHLEPNYQKHLIQTNIDIVDMECSAFFQAAAHTGKKAIALFYITDIIGATSPFAPLPPAAQSAVNSGIDAGIDLLNEFLRSGRA